MKKPKRPPLPAVAPSNWKTRWDCADPGFCELVIRLPLKEGRKFFANNKFPIVIADAGVLRAINKAMVTQLKLKPGKQKGADANRIKAEPTKKAVRKQFRELRKQGFSKEACDKIIAYDLEIDVRTVARHRKGLS
ncbi:MAG: hypothetical protein D4R77_07240 [Planctomycetaceae bacterium]|nr:MAG: hypothetical protein D4R77_07240 [Planctomycetaceae bacterium]